MTSSEAESAQAKARYGQRVPTDPYGCAHSEGGAPLLRCEQLVVGYQGEAILPPIDFTLRHGELCAVVGRNGAGKTSWFRTLLGLLPPVSGRVEWLVPTLPMGYIAQRVDLSAILPLRVADVVAMGYERGRSCFQWRGRWSRWQRVREALDQVDAAQLAARPFAELSEGQKQRVLFARLLVGRPHLAVLDEPTASMDQVAEEETFALIARLCRAHSMAVLIVSHQMRQVAQVADHMVLLDRATQTVRIGSPAVVLEHLGHSGQGGAPGNPPLPDQV